MKRFGPEMTTRLTRCAAGVSMILALAACGADPHPALAEGTFGGAHQVEIERACSAAVSCLMETEDQPESVFEDCVIQTAEMLNPAMDLQFNFLLADRRCSRFNGCDSVNCRQATGGGFGVQQISKVTHRCQAMVQCAAEMGTPYPNAQAAQDACVLDTIISLDPLGSAERQAFQDTYWPCAMLSGCAFDACFPF
jgi:hypothetical protein